MNGLKLATVVVAALAVGACTSSEMTKEMYGGSYCLSTTMGSSECSYATFQQCLASASGVGGTCTQNFK